MNDFTHKKMIKMIVTNERIIPPTLIADPSLRFPH
jgi:hypothetical protein